MSTEAEVLIAYPFFAAALGEGHVPHTKILKGFLWPPCLFSSLSSQKNHWIQPGWG